MRRLGQGGRWGRALSPSAAGCGEEGRHPPCCWFWYILIIRPNSRIPVALIRAEQTQQFLTPSPPCDGRATLLPMMAGRAVRAQGPLTGGVAESRCSGAQSCGRHPVAVLTCCTLRGLGAWAMGD